MKLQDWMKENGHTVSAMAELLDVPHGTVSRYINGRRFPEPPMVEKIHRVTGGQVSVNDWYNLPDAAAS